jgi:hypothetical protein
MRKQSVWIEADWIVDVEADAVAPGPPEREDHVYVEDMGPIPASKDVTQLIVQAIERSRTVYFRDPGPYYMDSLELHTEHLWLESEVGTALYKAPDGSPWHMLSSRYGDSDHLTLRGLRFVVEGFAGETVSPLHAVRLSHLDVQNCYFAGGPEDGLKLYGCRYVYVGDSYFAGYNDIGMQNHVPADDDYRGSEMRSPGTFGIHVERCTFRDIDTSPPYADNGALTIQSAHPDHAPADVCVSGCRFKKTRRAFWAESNEGRPIEDLRLFGTTIVEQKFKAVGLVGVNGATVTGNIIRGDGAEALIVLSGTENVVRTDAVNVTGNVLVGPADAGILVNPDAVGDETRQLILKAANTFVDVTEPVRYGT